MKSTGDMRRSSGASWLLFELSRRSPAHSMAEVDVLECWMLGAELNEPAPGVPDEDEQAR